MGLGRDKRLKLVKPSSNSFLSTTATRLIKVADTAPSDLKDTRNIRNGIKNQETGKVTAVAACPERLATWRKS